VRPVLPPDNHVHTEWSWDTTAGSMERTCARAVELGLPSVAFTEHVELTRWVVTPASHLTLPENLQVWINPEGVLAAPALDLTGYLECLERCRDRFPDLRILSGAELGEPHWNSDRVADLLAAADLERILGSVHSYDDGHRYLMIEDLYFTRPADEVVRAYLAEVLRMIETSSVFAVLAHIDYPIRYWPAGAGPYQPEKFEEEYRVVLRALARDGRALEVNTRIPLDPVIVRWWYEVGGSAVSFGSDAHEPGLVGSGFAEAAAMVTAAGFRPADDPHAFWLR
jgi:histidinol-phosphatase (PHP family)